MPWAGAHCYAMTGRGCRHLMTKSDEKQFKDRHMGATLNNFLHMVCHLQEPTEFGACYLNPPVGHYMSHQSTTDQAGRYLDAHWGDIWIQGGTRYNKAMGWEKHRKICRLTPDMQKEEVCEVRPEDLTNHRPWTTQSPPGMPAKFFGLKTWHNQSIMHTEAGGEGITAYEMMQGRSQCGNNVAALLGCCVVTA